MASTTILSDNGVSSGTAGLKETGGNDGVLLLQTTTSAGAATTAVTLDNNQNMGLGVTPSAWGAGLKAIQIGATTSLYNSGNNGVFGVNFYNDGTNTKYLQTAAAGYFGYISGTWAWGIAGSGTAGTNATLTQAMTLDASGNLGVGTTSPSQRLEVAGGDAKLTAAGNGTRNLFFGTSATNYQTVKYDDSTGALIIGSIASAYPVVFQTQGAERARIDSSGNLLVGQTSTGIANSSSYAFQLDGQGIRNNHGNGTPSGYAYMQFGYNGGSIGSITQNGTTAVAYNTSSDYRLKNSIAPMTGALAKVALLKPCTYKWNADNSDGEGFIAHELAEVCPHAVTGEKDAVDADGNPVYQGIDVSFLVATLTAAIQEQQAIIQQLQADVAALKG